MGLKGISEPILRNIMYLIWENDLQEKDFCLAIGINKGAVTDWRLGTTQSYMRHLDKIASYFNVSVLDLMSAQFIADRLTDSPPKGKPVVLMDYTERLNEFHGFPRDIQEVGLDVMRGLAKRRAGD